MVRIRTVSAVARPWAAAALAITLAGCGSSSSGDGAFACPAVALVGELTVLSRFGGPTVPADQQAFYGEITSAGADCEYDDDEVELTVTVLTVYDRPPGRPAADEPVEFFVAVERPDGTVIAKQSFATTVMFRDGEIRAGYQEQVEITLPLPSGPATGSGFTVYVGYQLTAAELEYNRQRRP